jgi:hypothetical protein
MAIRYILLPFWSILWPFGIFYGHLVYFMAIWYILWPFGIFIAGLVYFSSFLFVVPKNLATLCRISIRWVSSVGFRGGRVFGDPDLAAEQAVILLVVGPAQAVAQVIGTWKERHLW